MSSLNKLFQTVLGGRSDRNLRFADLRRILLSLNFNERITGGHHIFSRQGIAEIVNLQPLSGGKAKPYQVTGAPPHPQVRPGADGLTNEVRSDHLLERGRQVL